MMLAATALVDFVAQRIVAWHASTDRQTDPAMTPSRGRCDSAAAQAPNVLDKLNVKATQPLRERHDTHRRQCPNG